MKLNSYFKNEKYAKVIMSVLIFLLILIVAGLFAVRAEDNKTIVDPTRTSGGFPKILDKDKWSSQLVYDTIGACYQGTIRWILLTNPSLMGQAPGPMAQRQMVEHCFCVMDKVRKEQPIKEYKENVFNKEFIGNLFMVKALECVAEYHTLPTFFATIPTPDNKTVNPTEVPDGETEDSQEESPDQEQEESEGFPQTIFQG